MNEKTFIDATIPELAWNAALLKFELKIWSVKLQIFDIWVSSCMKKFLTHSTKCKHLQYQ